LIRAKGPGDPWQRLIWQPTAWGSAFNVAVPLMTLRGAAWEDPKAEKAAGSAAVDISQIAVNRSRCSA
jgi:hypothetical protein